MYPSTGLKRKKLKFPLWNRSVACCVRFLNSVSTNTIKRVDWRRVAPPQDVEPTVDKLKVDGLAHFILPVTDKITTPKDYNNENSFPTLLNFAPKNTYKACGNCGVDGCFY